MAIVLFAIAAVAALTAQGCATGTAEGADSGGVCMSPNTMCGAACVDTGNDPSNCGACNTPCTGGLVCSQAHCSSTCTSGTLCTPDGGQAVCAMTATDPKNCGSCGNACTNGQTCSAGKCSGSSACGQGESSCPGADGGPTCVNEQTDPNHCGTCTTICLPQIETCNEGACVSTCTMGQTLCIPDAGVVDGGPVAHCADLQTSDTDCGSCFNACLNGATCAVGVCSATLLGLGTAASPWHTATALTNCADYLTSFPSAADGVYTTHPSTTDIGVYCDMKDGGVTYQDFGFGAYSKTVTGYTWIGATDFGSTEVDAAFAYLFTRNGGLTNIDSGFISSNCCFINSGGTNYFGLDSSTYMYPGSGTTFSCNPSGGYTAAIIPLYLVSSSTTITTITASEAGTVTTSTTCSVGNNPAIFVMKY